MTKQVLQRPAGHQRVLDLLRRRLINRLRAVNLRHLNAVLDHAIRGGVLALFRIAVPRIDATAAGALRLPEQVVDRTFDAFKAFGEFGIPAVEHAAKVFPRFSDFPNQIAKIFDTHVATPCVPV